MGLFGFEGSSPADIHRRMVIVCGEHALSKSHVKEWEAQFWKWRGKSARRPRPEQSHVATTPQAIHKSEDLPFGDGFHLTAPYTSCGNACILSRDMQARPSFCETAKVNTAVPVLFLRFLFLPTALVSVCPF